jgi:hypothetical protein
MHNESEESDRHHPHQTCADPERGVAVSFRKAWRTPTVILGAAEDTENAGNATDDANVNS